MKNLHWKFAVEAYKTSVELDSYDVTEKLIDFMEEDLTREQLLESMKVKK